MIDIWIKDFNQNGNLVTTETLIQTIPAASEGDLKFVSATVKSEMGNAECLDFTIEGGTPFYDAFLQMKTYIRVTFDGDTIFYGRVLTIDNNSFRGTRKVRCEGPLSFLLDSQVEGTEESKRTDINIHDYLQQLLTNHNTWVENDPNKSFVLGEVPGNYSAGITNVQRIKNDMHAYGSDSWTDTKSAIEDLRSHYGGFLRARPVGRIGSGIALDWMNHYFNPNIISQKIEVGKNILDISDVTEIDNIFTVIIPIGKAMAANDDGSGGSSQKNLYIDGKILKVPDICNHFTREQLNEGYHHYEDYHDAIAKYGIIMKTVSFQDSTTKEALYNDACEWVRNNYQGEVTKFTIKAIDMRQIGNTTTKINIGDRVQIIYPVAKEDGSFEKRTTVQTCISIQYDLYHPENNTYTFGIPANILTKTYGLKKQGNGVNSESSGMGGGGVGYPENKKGNWLVSAMNWLINHTIYYSGEKPFRPEFDDPDENNPGHRKCDPFLSGYQLFKPDHYLIKSWGVMGVQQDTTVKVISYEAIERNNVISYVYQVYGIDLYTYFDVEPDGVGFTEDGKYFRAVQRMAEGAIGGMYTYMYKYTPINAKVYGTAWTAMQNILAFFDPTTMDAPEVVASQTEDGDYHFSIDDPDNPGQKIATSLSDLSIEAINTEKKVGWVVRDKSGGGYEFTNPGEITLSIENYEGGEIVVSRVAGQLTYLGNKSTQRLTAVSLNHMDSICGDFEYETNAQGISELKVKSGGGFRVEHYEKDENGNYKHDSQGRLITAEFGVFDDNTLTGGIVVDKINDNSTITKILGTKVDIRATDMAQIGIYQDSHYTASLLISRMNNQDPQSQTFAKLNANVVDIQATDMARIGIYTDDHYDAGLLVERINTGTGLLGNKIQGTRVAISADQVTVGSTSNVQAWMTTKGTELDTLEGLVADKITVYDAAIANLQADKIDANNINTKLQSVGTLTGIGAHFTANIVSDSALIGSAVYSGASAPYVNISNPLQAVQIVSVPGTNDYKLQYKLCSDSSWQDGQTFSRAGLVSGSWSGTTYTAVPSASGASQVSTSISASIDSRTDENVYFRIYYDAPTSDHQLLVKTLELSEDAANQRVSLLEGNYERARISTSATYSSGQTAAGLTYNASSHTISRAISSENKVYTIGTTQDDWSSGSKTVHVNINNVVDDLVTATVSIPTPAASDWSASYIGMQQDDPKMSVTVSVGGKALTGTVSASGAYSAGSTAGYNSAKMSGSWDGGKLTISKNTTGLASLSYVVSATAGISYDSSTHKYTASAQAKVDGTARGSAGTAVSGTEAWDAGAAAGAASVTISSNTAAAGTGTSATITATASNGATKECIVSPSISGFADGGTYAQIKIGSTLIARTWVNLPSSGTWSCNWIGNKNVSVTVVIGGASYTHHFVG